MARSKPREVWAGPRFGVKIAPLTRARSAVVLALLSLVLGASVAAALAVSVGYGIRELLRAFGSGT
ncbi:MAG TPA: hypothetical protein VME46_24935 [Acidimicrobiales bacterium]|nr:hypothetical protein [Acidimicrobiales bacterium]